MKNQFNFTMMCINGKYYLHTSIITDEYIYTDIKEYSLGKKEK